MGVIMIKKVVLLMLLFDVILLGTMEIVWLVMRLM